MSARRTLNGTTISSWNVIWLFVIFFATKTWSNYAVSVFLQILSYKKYDNFETELTLLRATVINSGTISSFWVQKLTRQGTTKLKLKLWFIFSGFFGFAPKIFFSLSCFDVSIVRTFYSKEMQVLTSHSKNISFKNVKTRSKFNSLFFL